MGQKKSRPMTSPLGEVLASFELTEAELLAVKSAFVSDMVKGWESSQGKGALPHQSTLKMLTSHVNVFATGQEEGVYFAVDLGGSNLRVLRVTLVPGQDPVVKELRRPIPKSVMAKTATCEELFDFIAGAAKELFSECGDDPNGKYPVGFTFSFPMSQQSINSGTLIEWTKGFETQNCVGENPAKLLTDAFARVGAPLYVAALCNDTVGTLMTCAYELKGSPVCRIGVILGTGTNAAYVDPALNNLILNIEWGAFDHPSMRRTSFDDAVDKASPNAGKQHLEKLVSGMYLGEVTRLACVSVLGADKLPALFKETNGLDTGVLSAFLGDMDSSELGRQLSAEAKEVVRKLGEAVVDRSAAICAAALAAVADKTLEAVPEKRLTVGIDGSLFIKGDRYGDRLKNAMPKVCDFADRVNFVRSSDGSGVGAAVIAAAVSNQH